MANITIYCDGLCEPANPGGWACWAWVAISPGGKVLNQQSGCIGHGPGMTNNLAEYTALIEALRHAYAQRTILTERALGLDLRADSMLVVHQVGGTWNANAPHLIQLRDTARALLHQLGQAGVSYTLEWIPRELNERADRLSRQAYTQARRAEVAA